MGKKNNNNNNNEVEKQDEETVPQHRQQTPNNNPFNTLLKIEMHCEGCVSKIIKTSRAFAGVMSVKADIESNKLTVIGNVDPIKLRDFLRLRMKKKVEILSPQLSKDDNTKTKDDTDNNKSKKEAPKTTTVLKISFHCLGCIEKIQKIVSKAKGVAEVALDELKETVTIKGNVDIKALIEVLKAKMKRPVEIVPPKKEKVNENGGGGKMKGGDGGAGGGVGELGYKMEYVMPPGFEFGPGYRYMGQSVYVDGYVGQPVYENVGYMARPVDEYEYGYGYGQTTGFPVHLKFNDENPSACSVM